MRLLVGLIIIIYLVGVGVVLSPTIPSGWSSERKLSLAESIASIVPPPCVGVIVRPMDGRSSVWTLRPSIDRRAP